MEAKETKKVLNQWEIDALLSSLGSQEEEKLAVPSLLKNVKLYDFRRPDKFSKDHVRSLQALHENFARIASNSLSSYLRMGIRVLLSSVEQTAYDEYLQQLSNPTLIGILSMDPLPGRMILEMSLMPAFAIVDRLLGGLGKGLPKMREATDIDFTLLETLLNDLASSLRESWQGVVQVQPKLEDLVLNPHQVHSANNGDVVVLLLFEVRISDMSGTISLCIPYTMLEPIMSKLGSQMWFTSSRKQSGKTEDRDLVRQLEKVPVPVHVQLGKADVSVQELLGLQKGNVIRLDASADAELPLFIGQYVKCRVRPGRLSRRLAVQVSEVVNDNNDNDDEDASRDAPTEKVSV